MHVHSTRVIYVRIFFLFSHFYFILMPTSRQQLQSNARLLNFLLFLSSFVLFFYFLFSTFVSFYAFFKLVLAFIALSINFKFSACFSIFLANNIKKYYISKYWDGKKVLLKIIQRKICGIGTVSNHFSITLPFKYLAEVAKRWKP